LVLTGVAAALAVAGLLCTLLARRHKPTAAETSPQPPSPHTPEEAATA